MKKIIFIVALCFSVMAYAGQFNVNTLNVNNTNPAPTSNSFVSKSSNSSMTASDIYAPTVPPGWYFFDNYRSVLNLQPGTTVQNGDAFGAYTYDATPQGTNGQQANAVGLFVDGVDAVNGSSTWGINTSCNDNTVNGLDNSLSNRTCIGYEADFTDNGPSTVAGVGLELQGAGTPAYADGFQVSRVAGSTAKWTYSYISNNGAATNGMDLGTLHVTGDNDPSQPLILSYSNASGTVYGVNLFSDNAALNVMSNSDNEGIFLATGNGNVYIGPTGSSSSANLNLEAIGGGNITSNAPVVLQGYTVSTLPSGQEGATAYVTDATSCTFMSAVTGGGSDFCAVIFNGSAWVAG